MTAYIYSELYIQNLDNLDIWTQQAEVGQKAYSRQQNLICEFCHVVHYLFESLYYKSVQKFKICHWIWRPWKLESNIENKRASHIRQTSCDWFNCRLSSSHIHNKITQLWSLQIHQKIPNKGINFYWSHISPEMLIVRTNCEHICEAQNPIRSAVDGTNNVNSDLHIRVSAIPARN